MTEAHIPLPMWDRIKLLLGFSLRVHVAHYCKEKPEAVRTKIYAEAGPWTICRSVGTETGHEVVSSMMDSFDAN